MRAVFRTDASNSIGSGHLMRCMALAETIVEGGGEVCFVSRDLPGNLCHLPEFKGWKVITLPVPNGHMIVDRHAVAHKHWLGVSWEEDCSQTMAAIQELGWTPDWLIVDHYALDATWESGIRPLARSIMVVDDLADRKHDCDVLLDQNFRLHNQVSYDSLVSPKCVQLMGPRYALLRAEFRRCRSRLMKRDGHIRRIIISFGNVDQTKETVKALEALNSMRWTDIHVDVIVGQSNKNKAEIDSLCARRPNTTFHLQVDRMADIMLNADLGIGACGATTWERCCLGIPSILISAAFNQEGVAAEAAAGGFAIYLGSAETVTSTIIQDNVRRLVADPRRVRDMARRGAELVDGKGTLRVSEILQEVLYAKTS